MKKLVNVQEVEGEGLVALLGERVLLLCGNYFYAGKLEGVNKEDILLSSPSIVYETGDWKANKFQDEQALPSALYVRIASIESYLRIK